MPDSASPPDFTPTKRTRVRRMHERGRYDRETVYAVLDSALLCHVGYVIDGLPYVTPTLFWREGERLFWHGSSASRMLRRQAEGIPVCVTVSHVDGLVLARSGFHHSLNYRAVMAFGNAAIVADDDIKTAAMNGFIERLYPGPECSDPADQPAGIKGDDIDEHGHRRGLGQSPRPWPGRRRTGLRARLLGRRRPDRDAPRPPRSRTSG